MSKEEILAGLKIAISRGESLGKAKQSFINAGYNPREVEEAALMLSGVLSSYYPKQLQQPIQQLQQPSQQSLPKQEQKPEQENKSRKKLILLLIIIFLILLAGIITLILLRI